MVHLTSATRVNLRIVEVSVLALSLSVPTFSRVFQPDRNAYEPLLAPNIVQNSREANGAADCESVPDGSSDNPSAIGEPVGSARFIKSLHIKIWIPDIKSGTQYQFVLWAGNSEITQGKSVAAAADTNQICFIAVDLPITGSSLLEDKLGRMRLVTSVDAKKKPSSAPTLEMTADLSDTSTILVLSRNSSPATLSGVPGSWVSYLQQDPFQSNPSASDFGNADTSYAVALGASFDLINKLKVGDFYGSIFLFAPNLWKLNVFNLFHLDIGFDAGIYQYQTALINKDISETIKYRTPGNSTLFSASFYNSPSTQFDNLGMYLDPAIRITRGVYLTVNFEMRRRTITTTSSYKYTTGDTVGHYLGYILPDNASSIISLNKPNTSVSQIDNSYLGFGGIFEYEDDNICADISPSWIFDVKGWSPNFTTAFNLSSKKYHIRFGGEIRYSPQGLVEDPLRHNYEYTIFLAKDVPISTFMNLFASVLESVVGIVK